MLLTLHSDSYHLREPTSHGREGTLSHGEVGHTATLISPHLIMEQNSICPYVNHIYIWAEEINSLILCRLKKSSGHPKQLPSVDRVNVENE